MEQQSPTYLPNDTIDAPHLFDTRIGSQGQGELISDLFLSHSSDSERFFNKKEQEKFSGSLIAVKKTIQKVKKKKYDKISNDLRLELIDAVENNGEKIKHAAERLGVNYSSAKSICQIYKREGRTNKKFVKRKDSRNIRLNKLEETFPLNGPSECQKDVLHDLEETLDPKTEDQAQNQSLNQTIKKMCATKIENNSFPQPQFCEKITSENPSQNLYQNLIPNYYTASQSSTHSFQIPQFVSPYFTPNIPITNIPVNMVLQQQVFPMTLYSASFLQPLSSISSNQQMIFQNPYAGNELQIRPVQDFFTAIPVTNGIQCTLLEETLKTDQPNQIIACQLVPINFNFNMIPIHPLNSNLYESNQQNVYNVVLDPEKSKETKEKKIQ